ncbi:unnamed protein product [Didymodactylos carnosus]|uniref:Uncharacterized protein n=1 Tax=Didymodactylos carnosus TaxID=1234261 RepID=A0A816AUC0_9BILA|nr:unnamed protein product [Didymodactylos carnosus]CAF1600946.1 unnamed protein product [Didymodactylos carnosus]CAF4357493.1 unnamed protein product [Didymodactylos carnosus]CAF4478081.1 unnamed protein product [Didymodactylos carnosus]
MEILQIRKTLKRKVIEESGPVDRIVEEVYHAANRQFQSNDLIINLPAIHIMKNTFQKQRRNTRPPIPQSTEQFPYPLADVYCKTTKGELFLLYDGSLGGTRSLVFASYNDIVYLLQQEYWYSDGTFYTCPSIFYQIYSIHTYYISSPHPKIYIAIDLLQKEQSLASIARVRDDMAA